MAVAKKNKLANSFDKFVMTTDDVKQLVNVVTGCDTSCQMANTSVAKYIHC